MAIRTVLFNTTAAMTPGAIMAEDGKEVYTITLAVEK